MKSNSPIVSKSILEINKEYDSKNLFSTCVFVNSTTKINLKTLNYFSGLVKLIETFKQKTKWIASDTNKWNLRVYINNVLFDFDLIDIKISNDKKNLIKLYQDYFTYLIKHKDKYPFLSVFIYEFKGFNNTDSYNNSPELIGTNARFLPLFEEKYERVMLINCCHAITNKLMELINKWIESGKDILTNCGYYWKLQSNNLPNEIIMKFGMLPLRRIPAGCSGYYFSKYTKLDINLFNNIIKFMINKYNNNTNYITYGNDEIILSYLFKNKGNKYFYNTRKSRPLNYFTDRFKKTTKIFKVFKITKTTDRSNLESLLNSVVFEDKNTEKIVGKYVRFWIKNGFYHKYVSLELLLKHPNIKEVILPVFKDNTDNFYDFNNLLGQTNKDKPMLIISDEHINSTKEKLATDITSFDDYFKLLNMSQYNVDNVFSSIYPVLKKNYEDIKSVLITTI
jgi:hypothetical protein